MDRQEAARYLCWSVGSMDERRYQDESVRAQGLEPVNPLPVHWRGRCPVFVPGELREWQLREFARIEST